MISKLIFSLTLLISVHSHVNRNFSYFIFVAEWAGSICSTKSCHESQGISKQFWNIHGLWPSDGSMGPNFCSNEEFNSGEISSLKEELDEFWSGLYASATSFHSHEWTKHGTCSGMSQLDFFSTVIELARTLDIYERLNKNGIVPGNSYNCSEIAQVIKKEYGIEKFSLQAAGGHVEQIKICVSKDLTPQDCPKESICSGDVHYPTFN